MMCLLYMYHDFTRSADLSRKTIRKAYQTMYAKLVIVYEKHFNHFGTLHTLTDSDNPDEMPLNTTFHQGMYHLLR